MSATDVNEHHDHEDETGGAAHGSLKGYLTGFILSVILTVIPFWIVMTGAIQDSEMTGLVIMALAVVQVFVHLVYFLHLNFQSQGGWVMLATIFTLIIVFVIFVGSVWVMYHLNTNMMPGMMDHSPAMMEQLHETVPGFKSPE